MRDLQSKLPALFVSSAIAFSVVLATSAPSQANDAKDIFGSILKGVLDKKFKGNSYQKYGNICLNSQDHYEGVSACTKALKYKLSANDNANLFSARGTHYVHLNDLERAKRDFDNALKYNPRQSFALNNRGVVHERQGNLHAALSDYHAASQVDGQFAQNYRNMQAKIDNSTEEYEPEPSEAELNVLTKADEPITSQADNSGSDQVATNQEVGGAISGTWARQTQYGYVALKEVSGFSFNRVKNHGGMTGTEPIEIHHLSGSTLKFMQFGAFAYIAATCDYNINGTLTLDCEGRFAKNYSGTYTR